MEVKYSNSSKPSIDTLNECVSYDPVSGVLTWKRRPIECFVDARSAASWNTKYAGKPVKKRNQGYVVICITVDQKEIYCFGHRVAWAIQTNEWPEHPIDHKNGIRDDNSWHNLRAADDQTNQWNRTTCSRNKSGFKGVHRHTQNGKCVSQIKVGGKVRHLGCFDTPE